MAIGYVITTRLLRSGESRANDYGRALSEARHLHTSLFSPLFTFIKDLQRYNRDFYNRPSVCKWIYLNGEKLGWTG